MGEAALGAFQTEAQLQEIAHLRPELILAGIPEIDPSRCPDSPSLISLGREVALDSGPIDNLYIDINAILTFVECKRYGDSRLKREVYPQAVNYASDLQARLMHYKDEQFFKELELVLATARQDAQPTLAGVLEKLVKDPLLQNANRTVWEDQFRTRLEFNIKNGICRVVVLCGPSPTDNFAYSAIRNLIRLMQFTERAGSRYDLLVMDVRAHGDDYHSKIVWRRYAELPQIPIIANRSRDTAAANEALSERVEKLPAPSKQVLNDFFQALAKRGVGKMPSLGQQYLLLWESTGKSLYSWVEVGNESWTVTRYQVKASEPALHQALSAKPMEFEGFKVEVIERESASRKHKGTSQYVAVFAQPAAERVEHLAELFATKLARNRDNDE